MKVDVLLGLQWGDEGKGKVVDVLTPKYDLITRFQGGPNAGHTLEFNGEKYILRSIPSGIFQGGKMNIIGNGVVLDPVLFRQEAIFNNLVKEREPYYEHTCEGDDDMPAHAKSTIVGAELTIPITNGRMNMGIWQGIYLCEFRNRGGGRKIVATIIG